MNRKIVGSMMKLTAFLFLSFSSYHVFFFSQTLSMSIIFGIASLASTFFVLYWILNFVSVLAVGLIEQLDKISIEKRRLDE